jgi:hypothetical protein
MIYVSIDLSGELGNQLFKIAAAYAIAKEYGYSLVFLDSWNNYMNLDLRLLNSEEYDRIPWHCIDEPNFSCNPITIPKGHIAYKLEGCYQSSRYFSSYADDVRNFLQIPDNLIKKANEYLASIHIENPDGWIAAHVGCDLANKDYFKRARASIAGRIGPRTVCWISEDIDWVYKNVYENGDNVISCDTMTAFACLSLFRHIIMSNSSYSWWATWLNPNNYKTGTRVICCPDKWISYEADWTRIHTTSG